jgi:hypothetical protein
MSTSRASAVGAALLRAVPWHLAAAAVAALFVGALLFVSPVAAYVPGLLLLAGSALAMLRGVRPITILTVMVGLLIVLDGDYSGYHAVTVTLQELVLAQVIPNVPTPFELVGLAVLVWLVMKEARGDMATRGFKACAAVLLLLPLVTGAAGLVGMAQGGTTKVLYWQLRGIMQIPIWGLAAYLGCRSPGDAHRFLSAIVAAMLLKTAENIWVYWTVRHGALGRIEYLVSHIGSLYMLTAMLILVARYLYPDDGRRRPWLLAAAATILYTWIANDRRSSMIGLVLTLLFGFPLVWRQVTQLQIIRVMALAAALTVWLGATWNASGPIGAPARFVKGFATHHERDASDEVDYRTKENYCLYTAIGKAPFFGTGFGKPFVHYLDLWELAPLSVILQWVTHNNILMVWANAGPLGIGAFGVLIALSIAAMIRLFRFGATRAHRIFAFVGFSVIIQWTVYTWGDQAFLIVPSMMLPAAMSGLGFKLLAMSEA